jgi:hypothetical protein
MNLFESFRAVRWLRTLNLVLQAVLVITFFAGLNYVAKNHPHRFDLTRQRKFSLSPETLSYIKNLQRPVHLIKTVSEEGENPEIKGLIDEFVYATEDRAAGRITTETLDVYQNRKKSEELGIESANILVLISGDQRRVVAHDELYTFKNKVRDAFRGEQALTAAILEVSEPVKQKIYFLVGHTELRISDTDANRGLSAVRDQLKIRHFDVDEIDLTATRKIPDDAALLVNVAPQGKFSRAEQEMLRTYLTTNAGRLISFLAPGASTAALGLDDLLLDWGILVHDDLICDTNQESIAENNDLLLYAFQTHPITKILIDRKSHLRLGTARTVMPDPGRSLGIGLNTITLAATSPTAWGERDYRRVPWRYDPGDTRPIPGIEPQDRLGVIVASERIGVRDNLPFSVRGGKVVVFGTGDLIANARLDPTSFTVFLNAVNWAVDRDRMLNIPPRPVERFEISLSVADFARLRYALLLVLPGGTLLLGLLVYWTRRA